MIVHLAATGKISNISEKSLFVRPGLYRELLQNIFFAMQKPNQYPGVGYADDSM